MPNGLLRSLVLASVLVTGTYAMTGYAQTTAPAIPHDATWLSVSAQGEASRAPDVASLSVGVVTQAADSAAAMRSNAEQMNRVMAGIREAGIADKDIRTSGVSLSPQYRYDQDRPPTITGYQASNTVTIKVRDIGNLGEVMDALAGQGANQIHGPNFEIDEPEPVYDEARLAALEKARARANAYARALGMSVRRIVSISEGGGFAPPMPKMMAMRAEAADMGTPVSPGENTVTVNLDVVFELVRGASAAR
jgi:uncharacterized protein YggE